MNISIKEFHPPEVLDAYVSCFWEGSFNVKRAPLLTQRVVPNGYVEIIIHVSSPHCELFKNGHWAPSPDYTIIGLHTEPYTVKFSDIVKVFGIRLKPEGINNLFAIPSSKFLSTHEDIEAVLGSGFRRLCQWICESRDTGERIVYASDYLLSCLEKNRIDFSYVNRAAEIIRHRRGDIFVEALTEEACISRRQLEREFSDKLGITPKQYIRLLRLNEVQRQLQNNRALNLTNISHHCGYADQAHFIREFKCFTGLSPRIFLKNREEFIVNAGAAD